MMIAVGTIPDLFELWVESTTKYNKKAKKTTKYF
jgi:hypothetical protein